VPLIVTEVPPEVGPEVGMMVLTVIPDAVVGNGEESPVHPAVVAIRPTTINHRPKDVRVICIGITISFDEIE